MKSSKDKFDLASSADEFMSLPSGIEIRGIPFDLWATNLADVAPKNTKNYKQYTLENKSSADQNSNAPSQETQILVKTQTSGILSYKWYPTTI